MDVKDLKVLSAHGAKIMKDVDTMVNFVNDGNDEKLVQKIHMVKTGCYVSCSFHFGNFVFSYFGHRSKMTKICLLFLKIRILHHKWNTS